MQVRFGDFALDRDTRQLLRDGVQVHLSPKAFDLLSLLVENRPRAIAKTEILEHLWPATFVSDTNLPSLIAEVRGALGDDAHAPRFVRTVHRFGYAFCTETTRAPFADARTRAPDTGYWLIWESREAPLNEGENILGREGDDVVRIDSPSVSRRQARIVVAGGQATLEDLGSKNGTYVGTERVTAPVRLADGDQIRLGHVVIKCRVTSPASSTETVRRDD